MEMELDAQTSSVETQTSNVDTSAASTPTPTETSSAKTSTPSDGNIEQFITDEAQTQKPAWTPDFKFKAAGQEHEIPEMYRGLIKDQKTLEEVKRLHEKAFGVDSLVQSREQLKKQIAEVQPRLQEYETVSRNFQKLSHFVSNGDFDSFFEALRIPEKAIIGWIQHKIEMQGATPEVRAAYEKNRELTRQQWDRDQELQQYRSQAEEYEQIQAYSAVNDAVSQSASDFAQTYDQKMGEGAFVDLVISKGIQITQATKREPPVEAVIELVKGELSRLGIAPQPAQATPPAAPTGNTVVNKKPTIPVIPAGGQSPVRQPVKSMEDLMKRAAALGD